MSAPPPSSFAPPSPPRSAPVRIAASKPKPPRGEVAGRDEYAKIEENPYKDPKVEPLSTFSIDVDTASYANLRRFITSGQLPPVDAVKIEEMINYFTYGYEAPKEGDEYSFFVHTELAEAPWNPEHKLLHIGLQGKRIDSAKLPPSNLVFLLDVSGSMHSADRLPLLKQALTLLSGTLRPQDKVSIVVYAGAAGVVLPPTPGSQRRKIIEAFSRLRAGGSTAGGAGIKMAYQLAREQFIKGGNNRVILATDGDFNVGVSSQAELVRLIERERESGVFLTVLGFGRGNYRAKTMSDLAEKGNGNHAYIDSILEAQKVLVSEMGGTLFTIAKDVKIQIEFNPAKVGRYRLIGYQSRILAAQDFSDDKKDAGELGAGHSVTALYELIPPDTVKSEGGQVDPLKYQTQTSKAGSESDEWLTVKLRYKQPDGDRSTLLTHPHRQDRGDWREASEDFRFSAGVAGFGMLLRDSKHLVSGGEFASWASIRELINGAMGSDDQGYRHELLDLFDRARKLKGK
jgi:Ca-activated chloride channel family protein